MRLFNMHAIYIKQTSQVNSTGLTAETYLKIMLDIFIFAEKYFSSSSNVSSDFLNNLFRIKDNSLFT